MAPPVNRILILTGFVISTLTWIVNVPILNHYANDSETQNEIVIRYVNDYATILNHRCPKQYASVSI